MAAMIALSLAAGCGKATGAGTDAGGGIGGTGGAAGAGGAAGTGGGPDGGQPTAQPIPLGQLCAAYTTDICAYFTQCVDLGYKDINHCVGETDCPGVATLVSEVAAGAVGYDAAKAGACHARFLADPCHFGRSLYTLSVFELLAECPGTLTPTRGAAEPCVDTRECLSGFNCRKGPNGLICPGTCIPDLKVGDVCSAGGRCQPGTWCVEGTCRPPPQAGDACATANGCPPAPSSCSGTLPCANTNLWCDVGGTGKCQKGVGLGAPCGTVSSNGVTTNIACDNALWCDAFLNESGTCRAFGGAGSTCNGIGCLPGLHCEGGFGVGPTATLGTCVPLSGNGGVCRSTYECQSGLACRDETCGALAGVNEHCGFDIDCQAGLFCSENLVCLAARYPGESCADPVSGCVRSLCRAGTCVNHAKAGQSCGADTDCASASCSTSGTCNDFSVCAN